MTKKTRVTIEISPEAVNELNNLGPKIRSIIQKAIDGNLNKQSSWEDYINKINKLEMDRIKRRIDAAYSRTKDNHA